MYYESSFAATVKPKEFTKRHYIKQNSETEPVHTKLISIAKKINKTLGYVTTKNNLIKLGIILSPIILYHYKNHSFSALQYVVNEFIQCAGRMKENYEMQFKIGQTKEFFSILAENPIAVTLVYSKTLFNKLFCCGIPFATCLAFKAAFF